ncbi:MAG: prepilin-type N-terminal cleavage/methylation domain-containing protein [Patescibacteria group bacterium]|nr:prepilin-type N-terminal cleavage/methylation domain-containing protein [Patescibacteria group bacterium]
MGSTNNTQTRNVEIFAASRERCGFLSRAVWFKKRGRGFIPLKKVHPVRNKFLTGLTGFTVIEMLVAMAVFALALVAICGIFLSITKAQRKNSIDQKVQFEASHALETIAQTVRRYGIDYSGSINNPASSLVLVRQDKESITFFKGGDNKLKMQIGTAAAENILSNQVKVDDLKFWIVPVTDPFVSGGTNEQPRVTIVLSLSQSKNTAKPEEQASIRVQTTITQRIYKR